MFKPASKKQSKLRLALIGPAGSGKTFSALAIASGLGNKIAVIDTERGSASLYSDKFKFDVAELEAFSPAAYRDAIIEAEKLGYDVIVIDSMSHAWVGKEGALEKVNAIQSRGQEGGNSNSFTAWRTVTPDFNSFVDTILKSKCHIIATLRQKTEYVLEEGKNGKKNVPRKVGLAPVMRDGIEFEFTVVADIDVDHNLTVSKTRIDSIDGAIINKPGKQLAATLKDWLESGEASAPTETKFAAPAPAPTASVVSNPAPSPDRAKVMTAWSDKANALAAIAASKTLDDHKALMSALGDTFKTGHPDRGQVMTAWSKKNSELRQASQPQANQ